MNGTFKVLLNGELVTYTNYNDIPEKIDNLIEFLPDYPVGPHTLEEHTHMESYVLSLTDLLRRETNASSN